MRAPSSLITPKIALWLGLIAVAAAPGACLYPSYTFNAPEGSGGSGSGGAGPTSTSTSGSMSTSTSTSSSSTSTSGSSTSGSSVSSSGSGGPLNDCNGMADCGNPMCTAYACVTAAPAGWAGYFTLYDGPAANDPGCPKLYPMDAYTGNGGLNAPAPTCSQCTCGNPTGMTCTLLPVGQKGIFVSNNTCAQQNMMVSCGYGVDIVTDGTCNNTMGLPGGSTICGNPVGMSCPGGSMPCDVGVQVGTTMATGGSCTASPQNPNIPKPMFSSLGHACGQMTPGMGCNVGQACLPKAINPYLGGVCISKAGENACPAAYPNQHIYYDNYTDTRACSACKCGGVTGASCSTTINLYSDAGCNTMLASIPAGSCADLSGNPAVIGRKSINTTFQGSCAVDPTGGQPTGAATGTNPVTYCCK